MSNFLSKLQILLNSRKIFNNWYIYPKIYFKLTGHDYAIFETKSGIKIRIRTNSTDLMALTNVWMIDEYNIQTSKFKFIQYNNFNNNNNNNKIIQIYQKNFK